MSGMVTDQDRLCVQLRLLQRRMPKCTTSILDQVLKTVTPFLSFPAPKRIGRMDKRLKNVSGYVSFVVAVIINWMIVLQQT